MPDSQGRCDAYLLRSFWQGRRVDDLARKGANRAGLYYRRITRAMERHRTDVRSCVGSVRLYSSSFPCMCLEFVRMLRHSLRNLFTLQNKMSKSLFERDCDGCTNMFKSFCSAHLRMKSQRECRARVLHVHQVVEQRD
jgi:hypothetical protein